MALEDVIAEARRDVTVMERNGGQFSPSAVWRMLEELERAAQPFTAWLSESDAMLRSGRGVDYFRSRFATWEGQALAERRGKVRYYRAVVVPVREARVA